MAIENTENKYEKLKSPPTTELIIDDSMEDRQIITLSRNQVKVSERLYFLALKARRGISWRGSN
ncbi:MAG: hypothetical protein RRE78_10305 [Acidianus sp.]|nr:hypothetical protein [Acidianus sp.]